MALTKDIRTGLLGYSLRKERLGEGLFFREIETFNYDVYVTDFVGFSISGLQSQIQNEFTSKYSGDVNVKAFSIPASFTLPDDAIRVARFNVQVEARKPVQVTGLNGLYNGLSGQIFWDSYSALFNTFSEQYDYEKSENGTLTASHNLSFSLLTGGKLKAAEIASYIFSNSDDGGTNAPNTQLSALIGSYNLTSSGSVQQFYTESYDLLKNSFSFNKKVDYPPFGSDFSFNIKKDFKNILELDADGFISVTENGNIKAKKNFQDAENEFLSMRGNNQIFNRCSQFYNTFNTTIGTTINSLKNFPLKNESVYNKPNLTLEYNVSYSDNPNIDVANLVGVEHVISINTEQNKFVNIGDTYNFTKLGVVGTISEDEMISAFSTYTAFSQSFVPTYYQRSELFNPLWPTITRIKFDATLPERKKNPSISFSYTNQPIYQPVLLDSTLYNKIDYKIVDAKPVDLITEYKIINRPTKTSIINYAYQTEKGEKSINITAVLNRSFGFDGNVSSYPKFDFLFYPLFKMGIEKLINDFNNSKALAFTYFVSDIKCSVNSDCEIGMTINLNYTLKKYTA